VLNCTYEAKMLRLFFANDRTGWFVSFISEGIDMLKITMKFVIVFITVFGNI
jgi:hypothetical protein